jgi:small GTP-binding protein
MIQKKICMVGTFGVGKTSLVARYVAGKFSDKYLTSVGVKISRKELVVGGENVNLLLWDMAGEDKLTQINPTQLRGASGYILVADGCQASTFEALFYLQKRVKATLGDVPFTCVINKVDLRDQWEVNEASFARLRELGWTFLLSSAKNGEGVEELFQGLGERILSGTETHG